MIGALPKSSSRSFSSHAKPVVGLQVKKDIAYIHMQRAKVC